MLETESHDSPIIPDNPTIPDASTIPQTSEPSEIFTADSSIPDNPCSHSPRKLAKEQEKMEHFELYRQQVAETIMQNAIHLSKCAAEATNKVPSAAEAVKSILEVYAAGIDNRLSKF